MRTLLGFYVRSFFTLYFSWFFLFLPVLIYGVIDASDNDGSDVMILSCSIMYVSLVFSQMIFNYSRAFVLPFSRRAILGAQLCSSFVVLSLLFVTYIVLRYLSTPELIYVFNHPMVLMNMYVFGYLNIVISTWIAIYFRFEKDIQSLASIFFLVTMLFLILTMGVSFITVVTVGYGKYLILSALLVLSVLVTYMLIRVYEKSSLDRHNENSKRSCGERDGFWDVLAHRFSPLRRAVFLGGGGFQEQKRLLLLFMLVIPLFLSFGTAMLFAYTVAGVILFSSPLYTLKDIGHLPIAREKILRLTLLPMLVLVVLMNALSLVPISLRGFESDTLKHDKVIMEGSFTGTQAIFDMDAIFNEYMNAGSGEEKDTRMALWYARLRGESIKITSTAGFIKFPEVLPAGEILSFDAYNPYTFSTDDPSEFVAYQLSRYLTDEYGILTSSSELLPFWDVCMDEQFTEDESTSLDLYHHLPVIFQILQEKSSDLSMATLKMQAGKRMFFIIMALLWVVPLFCIKAPKKYRGYVKSLPFILCKLCILAFILVSVFLNYLNPIVLPVLQMAYVFCAQYFLILCMLFLFFLIALYYLLRQRFMKSEIHIVHSAV